MINPKSLSLMLILISISACVSSPDHPIATIEPTRTLPTSTPEPVEHPEQIAELLNAVYNGVAFSIDPTLAQGSQAQTIPQFIDPSGFTYFDIPTHIRFDFVNPYTLQEPFVRFQPAWGPWLSHENLITAELQPQIFIFPTDDFAALNPNALERIRTLRSVISGGSLGPREELPASACSFRPEQSPCGSGRYWPGPIGAH